MTKFSGRVGIPPTLKTQPAEAWAWSERRFVTLDYRIQAGDVNLAFVGLPWVIALSRFVARNHRNEKAFNLPPERAGVRGFQMNFYPLIHLTCRRVNPSNGD